MLWKYSSTTTHQTLYKDVQASMITTHYSLATAVKSFSGTVYPMIDDVLLSIKFVTKYIPYHHLSLTNANLNLVWMFRERLDVIF